MKASAPRPQFMIEEVGIAERPFLIDGRSSWRGSDIAICGIMHGMAAGAGVTIVGERHQAASRALGEKEISSKRKRCSKCAMAYASF